MAAPNLVNVATITAKSVQAALSTTLTTEILANASSSNKVFKINNIIVANIDGSSAIAIASTVSVPADATLVVIDKNTSLYLEEGDNIEAGAGAASDATITINYEELS